MLDLAQAPCVSRLLGGGWECVVVPPTGILEYRKLGGCGIIDRGIESRIISEQSYDMV